MTKPVIGKGPPAIAKNVTRQPISPGTRVGKKGELFGIGRLAPTGARIFSERLRQILAETAYCEVRVGARRGVPASTDR